MRSESGLRYRGRNRRAPRKADSDWSDNAEGGQYQSGVDYHLDWGASHFFTKQFQLGLVGYYFQQVSDDLGAPDSFGGFRSRVAGVGPQIGFLFPLGDMQGYINLKGYKEFAAQNRPEGWNA